MAMGYGEKSWVRKQLKEVHGITKHPVLQNSLKLHKHSELARLLRELNDEKK